MYFYFIQIMEVINTSVFPCSRKNIVKNLNNKIYWDHVGI